MKKHLRDSESLAKRSCARGKCQDRLTCLNKGTKRVQQPGLDLVIFPECLVDATLWCQSTSFSFTFLFTLEVASNTFSAAKLRLTNHRSPFFIGQSPNIFFIDTMVCIWQAIHFKNTYFISWCSAIRKSNYFWQHTPIWYLIRHSSPG